jgi:16S rRNA (adenine1518-N6/adenine1519-N6)-dimethyltransferase
MAIEETSQLLRTHRIVPNKLLGQNFTIDHWVFEKLAEYANLKGDDVVLDAGAGLGFLTSFLLEKCQSVVAVEKDPIVARVLAERLRSKRNVTLILGDVLRTELPGFHKIIAIPPYYLSSRLVAWLVNMKIDCGVLVLQKEFAERLVAAVGSEAYGWLTVVVSRRFEVELFDTVPKESFYPQPEVDSVIVRFTPCPLTFKVRDELFYMRMVKWLFTQRNKKVSNALAPFIRATRKVDKDLAERIANSFPFSGNRVRALSPKVFGELADAVNE